MYSIHVHVHHETIKAKKNAHCGKNIHCGGADFFINKSQEGAMFNFMPLMLPAAGRVRGLQFEL